MVKKSGFDIAFVAFSFLTLVAIILYYHTSAVISIIACLSVAAFYVYYKDRINENDLKSIYIFMLWASAAVAIANICFSPHSLLDDEWRMVIDAHQKMTGQKNFIAYSQWSKTSSSIISEGLISIILFVFGGRTDMLFIIPAAVFTASAVYVFLLGRVMRDEKLGAAFLFIYTFSTWNLYNSSLMFDAVLLPLLFFMMVYHMFKYIKTVKRYNLIIMFVSFFSGFIDNIVWILILPFLIAIIFEYRKEFTKTELRQMLYMGILSLMFSAVVFYMNWNIIRWGVSETLLTGGGFTQVFVQGLKNMLSVFIKPSHINSYYSADISIMSFTETLMFTGGIVLLVSGFRLKLNRIFIIGLMFAGLILFSVKGEGSYLEYIIILPYVVIISGFAFDRIVSWKYAPLIIVLMIVFFINSFAYRTFLWKTQSASEKRDYEISEYIRKEYKNRDYLFVHETIPYGSFAAYIRNGSGYSDTKQYRKVLLLSTLFMEDYLRKAADYKGIIRKHFFSTYEKDYIPYIIYEIDVENRPEILQFVKELKTILRELNFLIWEKRYLEAFDAANSVFNKDFFISYNGKLSNTFIRYYQMEAAEKAGLIAEAVDIFDNNRLHMLEPADWHYYMGNLYKKAGKKYLSEEHYYKAMKKAAGWNIPKEKLF